MATDYRAASDRIAAMIERMTGERVCISCYGGNVNINIGKHYRLRDVAWRDAYYFLHGVALATGYPMPAILPYIDSSAAGDTK